MTVLQITPYISTFQNILKLDFGSKVNMLKSFKLKIGKHILLLGLPSIVFVIIYSWKQLNFSCLMLFGVYIEI